MSAKTNNLDLSFIMPAYNAEPYISEAIKELQKEKKIKWELIIIDDFSNDNTFDLAKQFAKIDKRIKCFKNLKKGKVAGINYGFSLSKGNIIKFIDSDDVLLSDYFSYLKKMKKYDAHCHDAFITDYKLNIITQYNINPLMITQNYKYVAKKLISFPKALWSFKRKIAKLIFPMPKNLPFEDVWINLIIKKNAENIYRINRPIYKYRQHSNQTYGGALNFNKKKVIFRAKRILKLITILKKEPRIICGLDKKIFKQIKFYFYIMSLSKVSFFLILSSNLSLLEKFKLILIKKNPLLAKYIIYIKWKIDGLFKV